MAITSTGQERTTQLRAMFARMARQEQRKVVRRGAQALKTKQKVLKELHEDAILANVNLMNDGQRVFKLHTDPRTKTTGTKKDMLVEGKASRIQLGTNPSALITWKKPPVFIKDPAARKRELNKWNRRWTNGMLRAASIVMLQRESKKAEESAVMHDLREQARRRRGETKTGKKRKPRSDRKPPPPPSKFSYTTEEERRRKAAQHAVKAVFGGRRG